MSCSIDHAAGLRCEDTIFLFFFYFFDQLESKIADLSLGSLYAPSLLCKTRYAL